MSEKPPGRSNKPNPEVTYLEAELNRAYQYIEQLRQQNAQLQEKLAHLEHSYRRGRQYRRERARHISGKVSLTSALIAIAVAILLTVLAVLSLTEYPISPSAFLAKTLEKFRNSPAVSSVLQQRPKPTLQPIPASQPRKEAKSPEIAYNITTPPQFHHSENLQAIVNELVGMAASRGLPTEALSITLIEPRSGESAEYRQEELRYPASVVKMFWLVILYAEIENGVLPNEEAFKEYISKMIKDSDNDAASFILDKITGTQSQPELEEKEFQIWLNKRALVNRFFQNAGYAGINIDQKTFPVYSINLPEPNGTDLQMRGTGDISNAITSFQAARLLYEICGTGQAVSPSASQKMCELLKRDLHPKAWQKSPQDEEFNPVRGFLGEGLAGTDVQFYSKAGLTTTSRLDSAFVTTSYGGTVYILTIFANDPAYASDWQIFPQMSRLAFNRMTARN